MLNTNKCICPICSSVLRVIQQQTNDTTNKYIISCPNIHQHSLEDFSTTVKIFVVPIEENDTTDASVIYSLAMKSNFQQFLVNNNVITGIK